MAGCRRLLRKEGGVNAKAALSLLRVGLWALALGAGCGGSASRSDADAPVPDSTGGDVSEPRAGTSATGGTSATAGSAGAVSSGNGGSVAAGGDAQHFGGTADAGAPPDLTLPPGCQPRTPSETPDLCSLGVTCDSSPSVRTYCHRLDSGAWECQCANQENLYRLGNVAGLQACALAAQICSEPKLELGEETCAHTGERSEQDSCSLQLACDSPIVLGSSTNARAWLVRSAAANCNRWQPGSPFACTCEVAASRNNYALMADTGAPACESLSDFCITGATPVFGGKEVCLPTFTTSDNGECSQGADCGPTMPLTDNVSLLQLQGRSAGCSPLQGGGSECYCSDNDTGFLFQLSTAPSEASCTSSIANCDPNAVITPTGPATCGTVDPDPSASDQCTSYQTCLQPATVDGRSIVARGSLGVLCGRAGPGKPWVCSFASGRVTARLALGAPSANPGQACAQASAAFLKSPGLYLGPSGDQMVPPDPTL